MNILTKLEPTNMPDNAMPWELQKMMLWELQKMIQHLEKTAPTFWTQEQYEDLFNHG